MFSWLPPVSEKKTEENHTFRKLILNKKKKKKQKTYMMPMPEIDFTASLPILMGKFSFQENQKDLQL